MNIEVTKQDIFKIGHLMCGSTDGGTCIFCNIETASIEELLLRSILKCFGDYKIVENHYDNDDGRLVNSIVFVTDLPYEMVNNYEGETGPFRPML